MPYPYTYPFSYDCGAEYPSDAQTRVTSLIHRYDRGTYTLEILLGEVISDFGLPEWDSRPRKAWVPPTEEMIEEYEPPAWVQPETPDVRPTPRPARPVSIPEEIDKFKRLAEAEQRKVDMAAYTLDQERQKFLRLAEETKAKMAAPPPEPTLAPDVRRQIEAEKAQLRARATPIPTVRPVSIEEEIAKFKRLMPKKPRKPGGARGLRL